MRTRPASTSSATTAPSAPTRSAMAVALPPGAAARSSDPLPRLRREHVDHRLAALVLRRRASVAHRRQAAGVADAAHDHRVAHQATRFDLGAGRFELLGERGDRHLARIGAQRDRGRFVHGDQRLAGGSTAEVAGEALDQPVGVRERDRVVGGLGPRLRQPREPAQVGVHEATRARRARADRVDRRRRPPRAAACRAGVGTHRDAARRAPAGRGGGSDASPRVRAGRRGDAANGRCRTRGRWRRRGRGRSGWSAPASPAARRARTRRPPPGRGHRARRRGARVDMLGHVPRSGSGARRPASHALASIARRPSGCTSTSSSAPSPVATRVCAEHGAGFGVDARRQRRARATP